MDTVLKSRPFEKHGSVLVKARENGSADEEIIDEIEEIVKKIPGVKETNVQIIAGT